MREDQGFILYTHIGLLILLMLNGVVAKVLACSARGNSFAPGSRLNFVGISGHIIESIVSGFEGLEKWRVWRRVANSENSHSGTLGVTMVLRPRYPSTPLVLKVSGVNLSPKHF